MCKPQEISNWLRSVYRISAGKWIPGRNKNLHCFVDFWEIEGIWTRIKIEEAVEAFVNLWKFSLPADSASFSVLWCGLLLLLFYFFLLYVFLPHFWHFTLFFLFLPPVNLNAKFWNLWSAKGSEKDKAFYAHFLPIQMVTSHSRDLWCMFLFLVIVQFGSLTQKKVH